jgi:glycosyltransferase involved in cell wall biosynthesis
MQEVKKRRIAIASVLKPVDDTRMFEKLAQSLAQSGSYEIHVFGYPTKITSTFPDIYLHASKSFNRLSFRRIIQPFILLKKLLQLKPKSLIVSTHELLLVSVILKLITGCSIYYDVQENYYRNILYANAFPIWLRVPIAWFVRIKELVSSPFITKFILAETGYSKELSFVQRKFVVLENKFKKPTHLPVRTKVKTDDLIKLLFSGTLNEATGVFDAIDLAKNLHRSNNHIQLTLIGYCSKPSTYLRIQQEISDSDFINLKSGNELVPHSEIIKEIQKADVGIIAYPVTRITENRMPTKLFEYLGCGLPVLLPHHKPWTDRCPENTYLSINFKNPEIDSINRYLDSVKSFDPTRCDVFWKDEAARLVNLLEY